jgi:predicted HTH domain antitoxin
MKDLLQICEREEREERREVAIAYFVVVNK